jgi:hypothetical protein
LQFTDLRRDIEAANEAAVFRAAADAAVAEEVTRTRLSQVGFPSRMSLLSLIIYLCV